MSENLEQEFEKIFNEHHQEIQDKLKAASRLIEEAVQLSEQYGIPFRPKEDIMWCNPSYIPHSIDEKFPDVERDFMCDVSGAYGYDDYKGWQSSQVC